MNERHSYTFEPGDVVCFFEEDVMHRQHVGKYFSVREILPVDPELIEFDPVSGEGGVGHHQHIMLHEVPGIFSGLWFQPKNFAAA